MDKELSIISKVRLFIESNIIQTVTLGEDFRDGALMTHKYRGSIVVLSISKSVEPNEEQYEMISGFQQGILYKY